MTDRDFWLTVRAALIMMVKAIEKRYLIVQSIDAPEVERVTAS